MPLNAIVNYHVHSPRPQAFHIDAGGMKGRLISPDLVPTPVTLQNARHDSDAVHFERDSVAFIKSPSAIRNFDVPFGWHEVYDHELKGLLRREIRAKEVIVFDHTVRTDSPDAARKPARNVHSDYSPEGAHQRLCDLIGEARAAQWQKGHFGFINVWRPVGAPINTAPLGFVRPRSVADQDWIDIDLIYPDRKGSILGLAANSAHEWVYMPKMTQEEVAIFNIYDNQGRPSLAHSAVDRIEDPKNQLYPPEHREPHFGALLIMGMPQTIPAGEFQPINRAFNSVFRPQQLSLGLVLPLDAHAGNPVPSMARHLERARLADTLGFSALWLRDVPFNVPSFGDAGQIFDPFVYLGWLAGQTENIALGVASIILPLRHPAHVAKAAASADVLSRGRLLLGIASGDRPEEYPALSMSFADRGARFRDCVDYIRAMGQNYPTLENNPQGTLHGGIDMLPKPSAGQLPLLITGGSQQAPDWAARHGDGWMTYPRDVQSQARVVDDFRQRVAESGLPDKPVMQSLYIDLVAQSDATPRPIHLGFQSGSEFLIGYLDAMRTSGINHIALNLRFNNAPIEDTIERLAEEILPSFHQQGSPS